MAGIKLHRHAFRKGGDLERSNKEEEEGKKDFLSTALSKDIDALILDQVPGAMGF